ncbi:MAG: TatD family hydrolase [Gemmatimonadota bacterium]|nr:TatD family hydrolase [Gemmatimonadota bacterium]
MRYVDLHAHMVSRTTDDYVQMALTGCVAVTEPAFWPGWDRSSADGFDDYFRQLTDFEPKRAAQYGIRHFAWLCLNPKEGENRALAREVLSRIPKYLDAPNVLGIGEIGLNRVTKNELATFHDHVELALAHDQLIHIHTPHLEDKYKGTKTIIDALRSYDRIDPSRVMIDHAEEHTLPMILDNGYWTGLTLYPQTKTSPERAIDMFERHGTDRIIVASACDWGPSLPDAVPHFGLAMKRRGHDDALIDQIIYQNPVRFLSQSPKFRLGGAGGKAGVANSPAPVNTDRLAKSGVGAA